MLDAVLQKNLSLLLNRKLLHHVNWHHNNLKYPTLTTPTLDANLKNTLSHFLLTKVTTKITTTATTWSCTMLQPASIKVRQFWIASYRPFLRWGHTGGWPWPSRWPMPGVFTGVPTQLSWSDSGNRCFTSLPDLRLTDQATCHWHSYQTNFFQYNLFRQLTATLNIEHNLLHPCWCVLQKVSS